MLTGLVSGLDSRVRGAELVNVSIGGVSCLRGEPRSLGGVRWSLVERWQAVQATAFEFQIGVEIDLWGLDVRMPDPEADARGVDPGVQARQGAGMAMRRNST